MKYKNIFNKKKILITGHTGFKGSWLTLWLQSLGAKVIGVSKNIPTSPSHYVSLGIDKKILSEKIDIKNLNRLRKVFTKNQPDFVFHLAAQSIVRKSYLEPVETWKTNLIGTLNVLEALRGIKKICTAVLITSDKAYKNLEIKRGYIETDIIGGIDPYGASKSAAEIVIQSYIKSFFSHNKNKVSIAVARAGNVIGGGDWSQDRLVPDCIKSCIKGKTVILRNPKSTRPWQHVLEVINGYLTLACKLRKNKNFHGEAFNFGPNLKRNHQVEEVASEMKKNWGRIKWKTKVNKKFFENTLLQLDSSKSKKKLSWKSSLSFNKTIFLTVDWYRNFFEKKNSIISKSLSQILYYERSLKK